MKLIDKIKEELVGNIFTNEEIDNIMEREKYYPVEQDEDDEEGILKYLVGDKQFNEEKVKSYLEKLRNAKGKKMQGRLDSFFTVKKKPVVKEEEKKESKGIKRSGLSSKKVTKKKK